MSEYAEQYRRQNREKAKRLTSADPHQSVDASGWTPPAPLDTEVKTGMRPISRRQYKAGGKVHGEGCATNAGRTQRKAGGRLATELMNRDQREANEAREGKKHIGGFKAGGRTARAGGGMTPEEAAASVPTSRMAFQSGPSMMTKAAGLKKGGEVKREKRNIGGPLEYLSPALMALDAVGVGRDDDKKPKKRGGSVSDGELQGTRPTGGRMARKHGGSTGKGKMNVNIVIAQQPPQQDQGPPPMPMAGPPGPPPHPIMPPPVQPPAGGGAPPGLPMTLGAGPPAGVPMPRRKGGRVEHMDAGAGSGLGRLEKVRLYGAEAKR